MSLYSASSGAAQSPFINVLSAELQLARGQVNRALELYQQTAIQSTDSTLIERTIIISMEHEDLQNALRLAQHWTQIQPQYLPAQFYVAHLALLLHDYPLAAQTLDHILQLDADAALDQILVGIYPEDDQDRHALLDALNQLDNHNNPTLLVMTAGLLAQNGQLQDALDHVNRALIKKPHVTGLITLKASILLQQQRLHDVSEWLSGQIQRQPRNKTLQLFYVRYLLNQKQQTDARKHLDTMARLWPQDGEIILLAALVSIDQQRPIDAEKYLLQLLTQDAYIDQAYYYLGINAERLNRPDVAEIYLQKVQSEELYRKAQKKIALLRVMSGRLDDAIASLTQERVDHPEHSTFLYLLQAQLLKENQKAALARQVLDEAITSNPDSPELIYSRVLLLHPQEHDLLETELERLLILQPDNATYLNAYAFALADQNRRLADARILAERANSLMPNQSAILDTLGYVALRQGKASEAIHWLNQAYQQEQSLSIGLRLAQAFEQAGQAESYQQLIQELEQKFSGDPRLPSLKAIAPPQKRTRSHQRLLPITSKLPPPTLQRTQCRDLGHERYIA